jgi:hypothetical protein
LGGKSTVNGNGTFEKMMNSGMLYPPPAGGFGLASLKLRDRVPP